VKVIKVVIVVHKIWIDAEIGRVVVVAVVVVVVVVVVISVAAGKENVVESSTRTGIYKIIQKEIGRGRGG
jgi:predicted transcriptional regulator